MDSKIFKAKNRESGVLSATLLAATVNSASVTPTPNYAPGVIVLRPGTAFEEHIYYKTKDSGAGTISGLTRDYTNLNGGTGFEHTNGSSWETLQASEYLNNIVDAILEGYQQEQATIAYVGATSFTVLGDVTAFYTQGRILRYNQDNTKIGIVASSSYSGGSGLTTVVTNYGTVPATLTHVEIGIMPKAATNLVALTSDIQNASYIYAADSGGSDAYAITLAPAITAYVTGQIFLFKANTVNTGAATLNVNGIGAKTIKKNVSSDLSTGDILAGQIVKVIYDGTNFQLVSTIPASPSYAADAGSSDAYAVTIDGVTAYDTGKAYIFKANTVNTGAATLNINALGAKTIKKNKNQDLGDADIKVGQLVEVVYDGTDFQMQSQIGNGYCLAMQSRGSTQSIANVTVTKLLTGTADKTIGDITNDTANSQITVNVAGFYRISVYFGFADSAVGEFRIPSIYKNTAFLWDFYMTKNTGAGGMRQTCQHYAQLAAGDDIDMRLYQNSGGNLNSLAGCYFVVERIGD